MFVLRYESAGGGFLFTRDGGKNVTLNPSRSFTKYGITGQVPLAIGSDGKLLIGQLDGLFSDDGAGCIGGSASLAWVADFAPHPGDAELLFFVTTGNTKGAHAGLWKRERAGTVSSFGVSEPLLATGNSYTGLVINGLKVVARSASAQGLRFVEVATRYVVQDGKMLPTPVLRFSDDAGATWTERMLPDAGTIKGTPHLLAASASTPMKLVVALEITGPDPEPIDPIFYSADEGLSFTPYLSEISKAYASLQLPDGRLLMAERATNGGLWLADSLGATPRKIANHAVHCLGYHAKSQRTYMCRAYEFGVLDPSTGSFCAQFQLNEARALSCASWDETQLAAVQMQLCNGWCGAAHFATSQVCSRYDDPALVCGVQARAYDQMNPDPTKRWIEPPGLNAAVRCADSAPKPPVAPPVLDAGAIVPAIGADAALGRDASLAVQTGDAGRAAGESAAPAASANGSHEGTSSESGSADKGELGSDSDPVEAAPVRAKRSRGGGCQLSSAPAPKLGAAWLWLGVLTALARRRERRKDAR